MSRSVREEARTLCDLLETPAGNQCSQINRWREAARLLPDLLTLLDLAIQERDLNGEALHEALEREKEGR